MLLAHALFLLVVAAALGAGLRLLAAAGLRDLDPLERAVFAQGLGLGTAALAVMGLGMAGLLRRPALACLVAALLLLGARDLVGWARQALPRLRRIFSGGGRMPYAALGLAAVALSWIFTRLPPVFFDALVYHLGLPQQYLARGGLFYLPWSHYNALPANAEMLYTLALGLEGEMLAQLLSAWVAVLVALSVASECRRRLPGSGWIGFAAQVSLPVSLFMAAHTGNDPLVALFVFQGLMAGSRWRETGALRWLALLSIFAALAAGTKYTGLYHALPLVLLHLVLPGERPRAAGEVLPWLRRLAGRAALALGILLALAGPWYARNLVNTGNPVYPAFWSLLGGSDWSAESAERAGRDVRHGAGRDLTIGSALRIPWDLVVDPVRFGALGEAGRGFWIFALAAVWTLVRRRELRSWALYAALVVPFWLATSLNLRYVLPLLAIATFLAAVGLAEIASGGRWAARAVAAALIASVAANLWVFLVTEEQVFRPRDLLLGRTGRDAYLSDTISYYPAARAIDGRLPAGARLLLVGETRLFYFQRPAAASSAYDRTLIVEIVRRAGSVEGVVCELARGGFTHLVYNQPEADRLEAGFDYFSWRDEREREVFNALPRRLRPWFAAQWVFILEVPPPPAGCLPA